MTRMKTCCCLTLKTGALLMTFANFICGTILLLLGFNNTIIYTNLYLHNYYFLLLGSALIAGALALLYGTTKTKSHWIFLYLVLSSTCLFILTIVLMVVSVYSLLASAVFWYGQICVNSFYKDVVDSTDHPEIVKVNDEGATVV
jgi:hypothetical protein